MSFAGPTAPVTRQAVLRRRIPADLARLLLAAGIGIAVALLGCAGMLVSTYPPWVAMPLEPFAFLLFPGFAVESLDRNSYAFSTHSIIAVSAVFYFCLALLRLFPARRGRH